MCLFGGHNKTMWGGANLLPLPPVAKCTCAYAAVRYGFAFLQLVAGLREEVKPRTTALMHLGSDNTLSHSSHWP